MWRSAEPTAISLAFLTGLQEKLTKTFTGGKQWYYREKKKSQKSHRSKEQINFKFLFWFPLPHLGLPLHKGRNDTIVQVQLPTETSLSESQADNSWHFTQPGRSCLSEQVVCSTACVPWPKEKHVWARLAALWDLPACCQTSQQSAGPHQSKHPQENSTPKLNYYVVSRQNSFKLKFPKFCQCSTLVIKIDYHLQSIHTVLWTFNNTK